MEPQEHQDLDDLQAASRTGDPASVATVWRRLTPAQQEDVVLRLLATQPAADPGTADLRDGASTNNVDDTTAMAPLDQTQPVPRIVADLRGLGASEDDDVADAPQPSGVPRELSEYWAQWLRRWKLSAVVAAWAVTTVFAFTTETSTFGPKEWLVGLFGSVILGGVLVGTLANFLVAAIPTRSRRQTPDI